MKSLGRVNRNIIGHVCCAHTAFKLILLPHHKLAFMLHFIVGRKLVKASLTMYEYIQNASRTIRYVTWTAVMLS